MIELRLRVKFKIKPGSTIDFNYQWHITAMVYKVLSVSAPEFSKQLHDSGYPHLAGPDFKFFTFSTLWAGRGATTVVGKRLCFESDSLLWRFDTPVAVVSSLLAEGLMSLGEVRIGSLNAEVGQIIDEPMPDFSDGFATFSCISPLVSSVPDAKLGHKYLDPKDNQFWEVLRGNLIKKWETLYRKPFQGEVKLQPDWEYIKTRKTSKLISLKGRYLIRGHLVPFAVEGAPQIIALGYSAGFGGRNSLGFGMVEVAKG
ncbi:CRISPR-associated protein, Cas6 family [Thermovirga lienii DSM 17291]|uniref:CRISPR-associated endoribonuclease n=1 Tax=Thermovirga lienii (strain ATCC BAA-1197 / DSM 17291 / Cas60314) TaxID=580340 RepID=G7V6F2_THELD|nr:CRISPR-associated endoribonuclease Cas6 [Thermovirga lienii]AER65981.1 CRISPR-associated protein, Cas6 family [Thermovirga lienii DSM 17291]